MEGNGEVKSIGRMRENRKHNERRIEVKDETAMGRQMKVEEIEENWRTGKREE